MTTWQMEPSIVPARFVADESGRPKFANVFVNQAGHRVEFYAANLAYGTPGVPWTIAMYPCSRPCPIR